MSRSNRKGGREIPPNPTLPDLFAGALWGLRTEIRTTTAATIIEYDENTNKATVRVDQLQVVKETFGTSDANAVTTIPAMKFEGIPVRWPRTSKGHITLELSAGDTGELQVHDRDIRQWLKQGRAVDPLTSATHLLSFGVFVPGLHKDGAFSTDPNATVVHGSGVKLCKDAALGVARLNDPVQGLTTADKVSLNALVTAWNATQPLGGPMLALPGVALAPITGVGKITGASTKVKAE